MLGHLYSLLLLGTAPAPEPPVEQEPTVGSLLAAARPRRRVVSRFPLPVGVTPEQEEWTRQRRRRQLQTLRALRVL